MQFAYRSIKCNNICSLPAICIWHSYVNDVPCFFLFFLFFFSHSVFVRACLCVCVRAHALFVSSLVIFFFFRLHFLPSSHSLCIAKQKETRAKKKMDSYFLFLEIHPSYFHCLSIKGEVRRVPQLFRSRAPDFLKRSPSKGREGESLALFPEQLNAL